MKFLPFFSLRTSMRVSARVALVLVSTLMAAWSIAAPVDDLVENARSLLVDGQSLEALALLESEESQFAGEQTFDYWLGMAAVRAGKPERALFPLERVILQYPAHAGARMELATAYLQLGIDDAAAAELDILDTLDPPPEAAERMGKMRDILAQRVQKPRRHLAFIGLELGQDDNPGTWPDLESIFGIPGVSAEETAYGAVQAGYRFRQPVGDRQHVGLNLNALGRRNQEEEASQFDMDYFLGQLDWQVRLASRSFLGLGVEAGQLSLDGEDYRQQAGGWAEWQQGMGSRTTFRLRGTVRDYAFELDLYDHSQQKISLAFSRALSERYLMELTLEAEQESADGDRPGGDAARASVQIRGVRQLFESHALTWDLRYARSEYDDPYAAGTVFNAEETTREDDTLIAGLQWGWRFSKHWNFTGRGQFRYQQSTIELYEHDQSVVSLSLTRYF